LAVADWGAAEAAGARTASEAAAAASMVNPLRESARRRLRIVMAVTVAGPDSTPVALE
jgi:hypothetical protein